MRTFPRLHLVLAALIVATPVLAQTINLESAPRLRLIEEQRFGSTSDPNVGFTRISSVTVDRDGNLYAFDAMPYAIKVFAPDGRFLRTIGRAGQGPGEFEATAQLGIKGDTVWVRTRGGGGVCATRIVLFRSNGTYLSSTNVLNVALLKNSSNLVHASPGDMLDDGRMISGEGYCYSTLQSRAAGVGSGGGGRGGTGAPPVTPARATVSQVQPDARVPRVSFNLATAAVDTVGWYTRRGDQVGTGAWTGQIMIEGRAHNIPAPPTDWPLALALRDGRVEIDRARAERAGAASIGVVRTRLQGDTLSKIVLRYEPVRYSGPALDSVAAQTIKDAGPANTQRYGNMAAARAAVRAELRFPTFQIPVTRAFAGIDGTIWIRREDTGVATVLWHIIAPNGQLRGTVALPRRANPAWMSGSTMWITDIDNDDVPWVVRYRIE